MRLKGYPEAHSQIVVKAQGLPNEINSDMLSILVAKAYEVPMEPTGITDVELANYVLSHSRQMITYADDAGQWFTWNGKIWEHDQNNSVLERRVLELLETVPLHIADPKLAMRAVKRCNSSATVNSVIKSMRRKVQGIRWKDMDADPFLLNCQNGVLDLRKPMSFRPARPEDLLSRVTNVAYDSSATCPIFEQFLNQIMLGDIANMNLLQAMMGYLLLGGANKERLMFFLVGGGRNGKSTLVRIMMEMMGSYATSIAIQTLLKGNDHGPRDDLMSLANRRLLTINEMDEEDKLSVRTAKAMTGNDLMKARDLYSTFMDIAVNGLPLISTNGLPNLGDDKTEAIWDRMRILPFNLRVEKEDDDVDLIDKLLAELPGILNFALRGLERYQQDRNALVQETPLMLKAKNEYRRRFNVVRSYLASHFDRTDPSQGKTLSVDIIDAFNQWASANNLAISLTAQKLKKEMMALGIPANATGGRYYCCLPKPEMDEDDDWNGEESV